MYTHANSLQAFMTLMMINYRHNRLFLPIGG
jgi:hypothetical protein